MASDDETRREREIADAQAEDQGRARRRGAWLDTDALNSERERARRWVRVKDAIRRKDRSGLATALYELGLTDSDSAFQAAMALVPASPPVAPKRDRRR